VVVGVAFVLLLLLTTLAHSLTRTRSHALAHTLSHTLARSLTLYHTHSLALVGAAFVLSPPTTSTTASAVVHAGWFEVGSWGCGFGVEG